jgi:hypothetical protein
MLKKRSLGGQGLEVSELGLGCMGMTHAYGTRDDAESIATIHRALELDGNLGAATVQLNSAEVAELDAMLAPDKVAGARYTQELMSQVNRWSLTVMPGISKPGLDAPDVTTERLEAASTLAGRGAAAESAAPGFLGNETDRIDGMDGETRADSFSVRRPLGLTGAGGIGAIGR